MWVFAVCLLLALLASFSSGFVAQTTLSSPVSTRSSSCLIVGSSNNNDPDLEKTFGGYTAKQRLREEVESPFRTVRLFFFGSSTGSALTALYFSTLNVIKAQSGYYPDVDMQDALQSCAINVAAAGICGFLTYRDWQAGNKNLARIAKGGALAKLLVEPAASVQENVPLSEYRRRARVLLAVGNRDYIQTLCRSLCADQLADENKLAQGLEDSDVIVVPVLLESEDRIGDTKSAWMATEPLEGDRNFEVSRPARVVAFPKGVGAWKDYLESEIETCKKQGFDVLNKGFTILVKKNGRILRRTTGQPPFPALINTMEVMDGSKFGMPGDDQKYPVPSGKP